jgi:FtsZ-binding cell division protein ZapB
MSSRPQTVSEVLCNEVGANHPDGALQQIRTMKRVLRSHYRAQRRLEAFGVNGVGDSVTHITALRSRIDTLRDDHKRRARANVAAADEALDTLEAARQRLRDKARSWNDLVDAAPPPDAAETPSASRSAFPSGAALSGAVPSGAVPSHASPPSDSSPASHTSEAAPLSRSGLAIVRSVRAQIEELRLELWAERTPDDPAAAHGRAGSVLAPPNADLLDQLAERLRHLKHTVRSLRKQNDQLQQTTDDLRGENQQLRSRIQTLESRLHQHQSRLQALARRFVETDPVDA